MWGRVLLLRIPGHASLLRCPHFLYCGGRHLCAIHQLRFVVALVSMRRASWALRQWHKVVHRDRAVAAAVEFRKVDTIVAQRYATAESYAATRI